MVQSSPNLWSSADYTFSNALVSKLLAMIVQNLQVKRILGSLVSPGGHELAIAHAPEILAADQEASFWELARECSLEHSATLLGYADLAAHAEADEQARRHPPPWILNPPDKAAVRNWRGCVFALLRRAGDYRGEASRHSSRR
jgi:hypothetical protein